MTSMLPTEAAHRRQDGSPILKMECHRVFGMAISGLSSFAIMTACNHPRLAGATEGVRLDLGSDIGVAGDDSPHPQTTSARIAKLYVGNGPQYSILTFGDDGQYRLMTNGVDRAADLEALSEFLGGFHLENDWLTNVDGRGSLWLACHRTSASETPPFIGSMEGSGWSDLPLRCPRDFAMPVDAEVLGNKLLVVGPCLAAANISEDSACLLNIPLDTQPLFASTMEPIVVKSGASEHSHDDRTSLASRVTASSEVGKILVATKQNDTSIHVTLLSYPTMSQTYLGARVPHPGCTFSSPPVVEYLAQQQAFGLVYFEDCITSQFMVIEVVDISGRHLRSERVPVPRPSIFDQEAYIRSDSTRIAVAYSSAAKAQKWYGAGVVVAVDYETLELMSLYRQFYPLLGIVERNDQLWTAWAHQDRVELEAFNAPNESCIAEAVGEISVTDRCD